MIALVNAEVLPIEGRAFKQAAVLIDKGIIIALKERLDVPSDATLIDAKGLVITPGLIDAHTHLGVYSEAQSLAGEDINETSDPVTPELDVIDAINPDDIGLADALAGGVTTVMIAPGSANAIGGQCMVINTKSRPRIEEMIVKRHAGLKIAFGENPKRVYGSQKKPPVTRMAIAALIRKTLFNAKEYLKNSKGKTHKTDISLEAVSRVLKGEMPLRAHAHRSDDIISAFRIADEFKTDIIIEHATEAHLIADFLKEKKARLVLGPHLITRSKLELKARSFEAPAVLNEKGIDFAIMSDHPVLPSAFLPVYAALAARFGLEKEAALKAITLTAAKILGVDDKKGSIKAGKDADLVVWDGYPLETMSKPKMIFTDKKMGVLNERHTISSWQEF